MAARTYAPKTRDLKHPAYAVERGEDKTDSAGPRRPRRDNANDDGEALILQHLPIEIRLMGRFGYRGPRDDMQGGLAALLIFVVTGDGKAAIVCGLFLRNAPLLRRFVPLRCPAGRAAFAMPDAGVGLARIGDADAIDRI